MTPGAPDLFIFVYEFLVIILNIVKEPLNSSLEGKYIEYISLAQPSKGRNLLCKSDRGPTRRASTIVKVADYG